MRENKNWDFLNILTKKEIILFVKQHCFFQAPSKREVGIFKWELVDRKLQEEMQKNTNNKEPSILAKKADDLAIACNAETDLLKKLKILDKRQKLIEKIQAHHNEWKIICDKQRKNDSFFEKLQRNENERS